MRSNPMLLAIGFNLPNTGLSRVMHNILRPLQDRYDIHYIGIGHKAPMHKDGITFHPCNLKGGDLWGVFQGKAFIKAHRPDLVFLLNDYWLLETYMRQADVYTAHSKLVVYTPLDGTIFKPASIKHLKPIDRIVVYNEFGRKELIQTATTLQQDDPTFRLPPISIIPHGVNTDLFHPLSGDVANHFQGEGRRQARQAAFPDQPDWHNDAFIVLNANQAQPRKRIDLTIEGFARFAQGKPDNVKLYLHHAILRDDIHAELMDLAHTHGIVDRLKLTPVVEKSKRGVSDETLNLIYNACDVGLNTSLGEGWGLIAFEHGATGAAQIMPKHSACAELWPGAAELVETVETIQMGSLPLEMAAVSPEGVANALERLYQDRTCLQSQATAAYELATQPQFCWSNIAKQWDQLFQEVLAT